MDMNTLHREFLREGSAGYAVIRRFYYRYSDALAHSTIVSIDDVVHEVFISLSKTDFTKVKNIEHYVMRAIKFQCWSLLDRALRMKAVSAERQREAEGDQERTELIDSEPADQHLQLTELEGIELLGHVNLFKAQLGGKEGRLLNMLIDGAERAEIAQELALNMNTLDTQIRRLRIRLVGHLKALGYVYPAFQKFE